MIYGIDFDGTIVENKYPAIGMTLYKTYMFIKKLEQRGDKWILITMREGEELQKALDFLKRSELHPSAVNNNLPELIVDFGRNPRKIYADVYIDDRNAGGLLIPEGDD